MDRTTILSPCRTYRYTLWREFGGVLDDSRYVMFIGLNPSTADEVENDPTIRRCIGFAKSWGYNTLCMVNLFAFRTKEPADMLKVADPIGPDNDQYLVSLAREASVVVAAWGNDGAHLGRDAAVRAMLPNLYCLSKTKAGQPGHPFILKRTCGRCRYNPLKYTAPRSNDMELHPGYIAGCLKRPIEENPHPDVGPERDEWHEQYRVGRESREMNNALEQASVRLEAIDPEWKAGESR